MKANDEMRLAVLIDGDNIPYSNIKGMMEEIARFGVPTFKRIYGDWTKPQLNGWKTVLLENAIIPIQQYGYTTGKNSTDAAMIIDAMDILYSDKVNGFCIVSSDSDFTRLATRLRESGMKVIGMGEKKTPMPFIVACDKFIYLEILTGGDEKEGEKKGSEKEKRTVQKLDNKLIQMIKSSIEDLADDDGWAFLGEVGQLLNKKSPDFDPRNYGFTRLTPLLKSLKKSFEVDERLSDKSNTRHVYVRAKKKTSN
jgi:hypothetical protein